MSNLAQLFVRSGSFFMFALLEMISFYLVVNFNSAQQAVALETWSLYSNKVMNRYAKITGYISLEEENERLHEQNAALLAQLPQFRYTESVSQDSVSNDSLRQRYSFLVADVVNKSPLGQHNSFVVNRGRFHGVESSLGVLGPRGLVGVTTAVSNRHARIMTLLHRDLRVSAGLRNKGYYGTLNWDGDDPRYMILSAIPRYVEVAAGDTVETTGYSNIFPSGITIGTVKKFEAKNGDNNWNIIVGLIDDILRTQHVYIVTDLLKKDLAYLYEQKAPE